MSKQEIEQKIMKIVKNNLPSEKNIIQLEDEFIADLGFDSIRFMGLFYCLEDEFGIDIVNSENNYLFFSIITVNDMLEVLDTVL